MAIDINSVDETRPFRFTDGSECDATPLLLAVRNRNANMVKLLLTRSDLFLGVPWHENTAFQLALSLDLAVIACLIRGEMARRVRAPRTRDLMTVWRLCSEEQATVSKDTLSLLSQHGLIFFDMRLPTDLLPLMVLMANHTAYEVLCIFSQLHIAGSMATEFATFPPRWREHLMLNGPLSS